MSEGRARFAEMTAVSRETLERFDAYAALLEKWNRRINLVSPSTLGQVWERHFLDSAQVAEIGAGARSWADLGSGAGFPGLVTAILLAERDPAAEVRMIESDQRKAAFLVAAIRETGVKARVVSERIEAAEPAGAEAVTARALAPLDQLLGYAERHLAPGGNAIFLKGAKAADERKKALERWAFDCDEYPSRTEPGAVILKIGDIRRV